MKLSLIAAFFATALALSPVAATKAGAEADKTVRTISVQGNGSVSAAPDMATINAGVTSRAGKPADALSQNSKAVGKLFQVLKRFGINDKDMRSVNFNLSPIYDRRRNACPGAASSGPWCRRWRSG